MTHDLIIIGAGPGGCAAAITAARGGATVLLLERGSFPRQKVCGEFVSAESLGLLEDLLAPAHRGLVASAPRIPHSRVFAENSVLPIKVDPAAASIPRYALDSALWHSARDARMEAQENVVVRAVEGNGPFTVACEGVRYFARAVVNASGRWSFLTHPATRARAASERWIGTKAHFHEAAKSDSVDLYFFDGGYCGVQPVTAASDSGHIVNACAMVRAEIAAALPEVLMLNPWLNSRSREWKRVTEPVTTSPLIFHDPEPIRGNMLLVGDAATFVDPFIGDGISLALRSGALASQCLGRFFAGQQSLKSAVRAYDEAYRKSLVPVFRSSSVLRKLLSFPRAVRRPVLSFLQHTPALTAQLVRFTR